MSNMAASELRCQRQSRRTDPLSRQLSVALFLLGAIAILAITAITRYSASAM